MFIWEDIKSWRNNDFEYTKEQIEAETKAWAIRWLYTLIKTEDYENLIKSSQADLVSDDELLDEDIILINETGLIQMILVSVMIFICGFVAGYFVGSG